MWKDDTLLLMTNRKADISLEFGSGLICQAQVVYS